MRSVQTTNKSYCKTKNLKLFMPSYQYLEEQEPKLQNLMHAELLDLDRRLAELTPADRTTYLKKIAADVASGRPYAYCVGSAPFREFDLIVNESVLIPRPETEMMPDIVREIWKQRNPKSLPTRILDIGTGSGCLAISLAAMYPNAYVEAWDVSPDALEVAIQNAAKNKAKVTFKTVDVLAEIPDNLKPFDIIVSNPPYVAKSEVGEDLSDSVFRHEPHLALFAEDEGLAFYQKFVEVFPVLLSANGVALLEHGHMQAEGVRGFFGEAFQVESLDDLQGRPRFLLVFKV